MALVLQGHETCAGSLELHSVGVFNQWKRFFFQVLQGDNAARLVQYASEGDHAGGRKAPLASFDLLMVEDIVEPADAPKSWFELWFSNGAVVRLRAPAADWSTWCGHLLIACPKVMHRLASTLASDEHQVTPVGTSAKQVSRSAQLRSLRHYALRDDHVQGLAAEHPAISRLAAGVEEEAAAAAAAAAAAGVGAPAADGAGAGPLSPGGGLSAVRAFASELSDALASETHARSAMIEDRISHHMSELETNVKASHVGQVQTIATLAASMDVLAGGMAEAVDTLKEVSGRGADAARGLAAVQLRVDAVGARVEENALKARAEAAALRGAVEHVERLLLQSAPKVVPAAPAGGKAATAAALRAAAGGGPVAAPAPAPHHAVDALHTALSDHSSQVDEGLAHIITQQKALEATVQGVEGAVGAMSHMLADVVRAMHQLSARQEALCQLIAGGGGGGGAGGEGGALRAARGAGAGTVTFAAPAAAAPPAPPARATPLAALRRPAEPPTSPHSTGGFGEHAQGGAAALKERKAALLSDLSLAAGTDLTASLTAVGASHRLPASVKGRADVKAILERIRDVEEQLHAATSSGRA
jgi:hypothetical protein